jgi:Domain of unknown function (DUF4304)
MPYSLIAVFDEIIKENIAPFLKKQGFKKQNLNFYKTEGDVIFMFNFQKNTYNSVDYIRFYTNCGIYSQDVALTIGEAVLPNPKEYQCLYNARIDRITGSGNKDFELVSSGEKNKNDLAVKVIAELEAVTDFYKTIKNHDDLLDLCVREGTYFWRELFQYLALIKDTKRIDEYAKNFGNNWKGDERAQFFEDEMNKILLENGFAPIVTKP